MTTPPEGASFKEYPCCPLCGKTGYGDGQHSHCSSDGCDWYVCQHCLIRYSSIGLYLPLRKMTS